MNHFPHCKGMKVDKLPSPNAPETEACTAKLIYSHRLYRRERDLYIPLAKNNRSGEPSPKPQLNRQQSRENQAMTALPLPTKEENSKGARKKLLSTAKEVSKEDAMHRIQNTQNSMEGSKETKTKRLMTTAKPDTVDHMKTARLLHEGDVLLERFEVEGLLAGGGFAQVYLAKDMETGRKCAIKAQGGNEHVRRMKLEMLLFCALRGKRHIPTLLGMSPLTGKEGGMALILDLVGRSLAEVRRQMPGRKFSPPTLYRSMNQVLSAITQIHFVGFLHRDVKPPNCCLGIKNHAIIYLLDFGLCRQFIEGGGLIRRARKTAPFRGTLRYASVAGHEKKEFGPCNDLIAFLYSTVELGSGGLQWSHIPEKEKIEKVKRETTNAQLCHSLPELLPFADYVMGLRYDTIPDYDLLKELFGRCIPNDITNDTPYDWNIHPCDLELAVRADEGNLTTPDCIEGPDPPAPRKHNSRGS